MRLPSPNSLRTKLIVTTLAVISCLLVAIGFVVEYGARTAILQSVDENLGSMADDEVQEHQHHGHRPHRRTPPASFDIAESGEGGLHAVYIPVTADEQSAFPRIDPDAFALAKTGAKTLRTVTTKDGPVRVLTQPIYEDGSLVAIVQSPHRMGEANRSIGTLRRTLLTIIPLGILVTGFASLFVVGKLMGPLGLMNEKAKAIGAGNLAERLPVLGNDEFASLASTFNDMLSRIEAAFLMEQDTNRRLEESVAIQRAFTADASHELKTPLAMVKANAGLLLDVRKIAEPNREAVEIIDGAADRMTKLVRDLLVLARVESPQLSANFLYSDLRDIAAEAVIELSGSAGNICMEAPEEPMVVSCVRDDLTRVLVNLLSNALLYSKSKDCIRLILTKKDGLANASVIDTGLGIAPEHLPRLFDRFYRIDKSRSSSTGGTGLGLAICKSIVEGHAGRIAVESELGKGTKFTFEVPLATA